MNSFIETLFFGIIESTLKRVPLGLHRQDFNYFQGTE